MAVFDALRVARCRGGDRRVGDVMLSGKRRVVFLVKLGLG